VIKVYSVAVVTSIHPDFDARIWKHVRSLADNGIRVEFVSPWKPSKGNEYANITFHHFPRIERRLLRPFLVPVRVLYTLATVIRKVQIIHFHDIDLLPLMAGLSIFKNVVYDVHENYAEEMMVRDWIPKTLRHILKWSIECAHSFFPKFIKNIVLVVPHQKLEFSNTRLNCIFLYNYASIKLLEGFKSDYSSRPQRIIFTGGHYIENGSGLILEIAHRLKQRGILAEIWVTDRFASKEYEIEYFKNISNHKLDNVKVINTVSSSDIMKLLNQATIAIAPNLRVRKQELAIPTKLFEYMAASLPIVSSDLPYQKALFSEHKIGILARPEDPDSFVNAIEQLIIDKRMAESLGRNGQLVFKDNFTWESQIPNLIHFYNGIVS